MKIHRRLALTLLVAYLAFWGFGAYAVLAAFGGLVFSQIEIREALSQFWPVLIEPLLDLLAIVAILIGARSLLWTMFSLVTASVAWFVIGFLIHPLPINWGLSTLVWVSSLLIHAYVAFALWKLARGERVQSV